jgi:hypothetical protein
MTDESKRDATEPIAEARGWAIDTNCDAWHVFCGHWFVMNGTNPHPRDSRVLMCWTWFRSGESWAERKPKEAETNKEWQPMLRTGDLQMSLYAGDTLEIRDGQTIYAHLTPSETADFLRWIDARDKSPNEKGQR